MSDATNGNGREQRDKCEECREQILRALAEVVVDTKHVRALCEKMVPRVEMTSNETMGLDERVRRLHQAVAGIADDQSKVHELQRRHEHALGTVEARLRLVENRDEAAAG